jgi:cathepsin A (carboxypeptidase C)
LIQNCYDSESIWSCVPASIYCNNAMLGPYQRTGQVCFPISIMFETFVDLYH